jgi:tetratricopeptide (TPR) repeat protein
MKKSGLFLFLFLFPASLFIKAQPINSGSAESDYQTGFKLLQEGRAAEALPFLLAAVKINKESYLYRLNAGRAAQFSADFQSCVENLTEALRLRPKEQTEQAFYLWRAECNMELGRRTAAQSDYAEAVNLQPGMKWAYSYRIFYDTGNVCQSNAGNKYREAEAFYNANKIYEAYRELYVALKCDPWHLPSLKLRLKIETADNNLAAHAKIHRLQLEKIESANNQTAKKSAPKSDEDGDVDSDDFLDKVFDVKKDASASPKVKPASAPLLNKYLAQIEKTFAGLPVFTRTAAAVTVKPELYGAVYAGKTEIALDFIKQGADVNYQSVTPFGFKQSVLTEAIERGNLRVVKALLANPNCDLRLKEICPMGAALSKENTLIVALLIKHKLDVNGLYNNDGMTYLMVATHPGTEDISALLIEAGADESARNNKGETARQITERIKKAEAAKVPPTAAELRGYDIKTIGLRRKAIDSLTTRFNAHTELTKKIKNILINSEKVERLHKGIEYLDDIINNATEIEKAATRLLAYPGYDLKTRQLLQNGITEAVKFKADALKLKKSSEQALSALK